LQQRNHGSMRNVVIAMLLALLTCCTAERQSGRRAAYYWSTVFSLDSAKSEFVRTHDVGRIYLRYFDVVDDGGRPMPNATLRFAMPVPQGMEIVPVVFIVNDCMKRDVSGLADKILKRVMQMSQTNDVDGVGEIQIDCDWTLSTRRRFYAFLSEMRDMVHAKNLRLSVTVRLHQLSQTPPPADRGVLMMYNTGDFTDIKCEKPILDLRDAAPYLRHLGGFKLPLSAAYPVYSWKILFRNGHYVGIMHSDDELPVLAGDSIVIRQPSLDDILQACEAVDARRSDTNEEVIIFDISNSNIQRFNTNDYEKIFGN